MKQTKLKRGLALFLSVAMAFSINISHVSAADNGISNNARSITDNGNTVFSKNVGIFKGRYSSQQVFDCQRSPAFPEPQEPFEVYNFDLPYNPATGQQYTESEIKNKVFFIGSSNDPAAPFSLCMEDAYSSNKIVVSAKGDIYGLSPDGFFYQSSSTIYGYYISNRQAYASGDSLTYTPDVIGPITTEEGKQYLANESPQELKTITQTLDFTDVGTKPTDCHSAPINHTHGGDKCFTWDNNTYTLTMNNLDLNVTSSDNAYGLKLPNKDVTIHWSGKNSIKVQSSSSGTNITQGIGTAQGSLSLSGLKADAELTIITPKWYALDAMNGSITINEGILNITGGNGAISARDQVTINGGKVTAIATIENAWYTISGGSINLNAGTITAKSSIGKTPFSREPILGTGMMHDTATDLWNNRTGAFCTYKPSLVMGVTLNKSKLSLYSNSTPNTETLIANVTPASITNNAVTWESDNMAVATVDSTGKVTAVSDGAATITVTTIEGNHKATCLVTVSTYNNTVSSSSGGSSNHIATPPAPEKPNIPTMQERKIQTKVGTNGKATVTITDKSVMDAINNATANAKKNNNEGNGISLAMNIMTTGKTANSIRVTLPKTVQKKLIKENIVHTIITIDQPKVKISLDLDAIKEINKQANANVIFSIDQKDNSKLTKSAKTAIGDRPVYDLSINYGKGKKVSNFGKGNVTVSIPYTLQEGETAGNVYAIYVNGKGKASYLANSSYNVNSKSLLFSTNHFSAYGVGYKSKVPVFTDIDNHWAKPDIEFVTGRGLLSGTIVETFSPNSFITRGAFVTALGRMANVDVTNYRFSSFTDVEADAYYAPYVNWAVSKNIIKDIENNQFAPDKTMTREEMALAMSNYAKATGFTLPKTRCQIIFADAYFISPNAATAVKEMQMAGVAMGKDSSHFDPKGSATRAEFSAILHRYIELFIDHTTAQGVDINDSGEVVHYEDGKLITDTKNS